MEQETLPQNKLELKKFIIQTFSEIAEGSIHAVSKDEESEIQELHGDSLENPRDIEEYESL